MQQVPDPIDPTLQRWEIHRYQHNAGRLPIHLGSASRVRIPPPLPWNWNEPGGGVGPAPIVTCEQPSSLSSSSQSSSLESSSSESSSSEIQSSSSQSSSSHSSEQSSSSQSESSSSVSSSGLSSSSNSSGNSESSSSDSSSSSNFQHQSLSSNSSSSASQSSSSSDVCTHCETLLVSGANNSNANGTYVKDGDRHWTNTTSGWVIRYNTDEDEPSWAIYENDFSLVSHYLSLDWENIDCPESPEDRNPWQLGPLEFGGTPPVVTCLDDSSSSSS